MGTSGLLQKKLGRREVRGRRVANHITDDQVRAQYINAMGEELGALCHELDNDLAWLHHKWLEFKELYLRGPERIDLLNKSASNFFYFLQKLMYEDAMLHLARLTDPPSVGRNRRQTLTVRRLPELISNQTLLANLQDALKDVTKTCDFARTWRSTRLAHTDREVLQKGVVSMLPAVTSDQVVAAANSIHAVLRIVEQHYGRPASIMFSDPWGAKSLVHCLERAARERASKP